jgi:simple sugar transport system ATP-binding protein
VTTDKLSLHGINKSFGALKANENVDLSVRAGTVHAILGENGAGKSTLMNILYGLYRQDSGRVLIDGREIIIDSPRSALAAGIGMVHQHFMLVGRLTVTENIVLGMAAQGMKLDLSKHAEALSALSQTFGFDLDPNVQVYRLPVGMQQRAEILKLLYHKAEILILDEPTSVLTPREIEPFFGMLRKLKADGKTILFISHKLDEVMAIADDITVMRAGKVVASVPAADANQGMLARLMVGREVLFQVRRTAHGVGEIILEATALRAENDRGLPALDGLSFTVRAGEVYGIAGVDGNGQSELAEVIAGLRRTTSGTVKLNGADITSASAAERNRKYGVAYVPEDRHRDAVVMGQSVAQNLILRNCDVRPFASYGFFNRHAIAQHAERLIREFDVRLQSPDQDIRFLSGGNQQKTVLARELSSEPRVLIVAQPTKGLDVGAIEFIQSRILEQRDRGTAILYISTELEHLLDVADRVGVMFRGRLVDTIDPADATAQRIGLLMAGIAA